MTHEDRERLRTVLAAYGADPGRWPAADRDRLAAHLAEAGPDLQEARDLDGLLASAAPPPPSPLALAAILAATTRAETPSSDVILFRPRRATGVARWLTALPLAASLAAGFYFGAQGNLDSLLPTSLTSTVTAAGDGLGGITGISDAESLAGEDLT